MRNDDLAIIWFLFICSLLSYHSLTVIKCRERLCFSFSVVTGVASSQDPWSEVEVLVTQSCPTLCDPGTLARQPPLSMGFSRRESWSGLPCPSLGDLPDAGIKPWVSRIVGRFFSSWDTREAPYNYILQPVGIYCGFRSTGFPRQKHWSGLPMVGA